MDFLEEFQNIEVLQGTNNFIFYSIFLYIFFLIFLHIGNYLITAPPPTKKKWCRHHHNGRWEARIGRVFGNKYLYLGTYGNVSN